MLLHLIADFGAGDLAFAEVTQRLHLHVPGVRVVPTPVPPFQTLAAGFCVAQLALGPGPAPMAVFHNVAPRRDDVTARRDQAGEALACAITPDGVVVIGVNAGYAFSFLREAGLDVREVAVPVAGSQFRSRDLFPEVVGRILAGDGAPVGPILASERIPAVPTARLAYVDGFGNMKTTIRASSVQPGAHVRVSIGGVAREAVASGGGFGVPEGVLAFATGSSGWKTSAGVVRWSELFLRGASAWEAFGRPGLGAEIRVQGLSVTS